PLYGEFSGNFGILQILPIDLQQIAIMKGSASTLYGADAVSGMINLISRRPSKKTEGSILLNQTSQDEKNGNFFISGRTTDLDLGYTLVAAVNRQTIRDVNNDGISDIPDWRNFSIHPKIFYSFNDKSTVEFGLSSLWEKRSGGSMAEYNRFNKPFEISTTTQRFGTELNYNQTLSNESSIQFRAATSRLTRELQNPEYYYKGVENILFTEASYSKKISTTNNVAGINFSSNTLNNIVSNLMVEPGYNLYTLGMFAQSDFNATENFLIQAGIRTDFTNNYGNSFLPHLAFMYKHSSAMSSRFNLGMGYKNPLIFSYIDEERELAKLSPNQQPLEHEKSMSANYAFDVNFPINQEITVNFNQSIFFISISNPVIRSYDTEKRIILQNASGTMESFGWQTYMRAKLDETELYLSYIYTHATQKSERGKDWVPATPLHTISAILTLELTDDSKIGIESSYFGPQFLSEGGRTPGYFFFAAMASYTLNKLTFVINCENLLNYRQSNYIEYGNGIPENKTLWAPIDGRVANISIKYSF
ncbi:MAG: TonB-dependent receptor, partial [Ignavibacteria bacterium]|nr:TonB-dependent receptor [Ignavibacteria bacterium]